jgi:hypothetical protein
LQLVVLLALPTRQNVEQQSAYRISSIVGAAAETEHYPRYPMVGIVLLRLGLLGEALSRNLRVSALS